MRLRRRRRIWLPALLIGVALLLAAGWLSRSLGGRRIAGTPPDPPAAERPVATDATGADRLSAGTFRTGLPGLAASMANDPEEAIVDPDTALRLARETIEDYRRLARYPDYAHPLEDGEDPILRDRAVSPVTARGPEGEEPTLTVFPERVGFESPERAILYAYLSVQGVPVAPAELRATLVGEDLQPVADLDYRDDGQGGDQVANDHVYTAVYEPAAASTSALSVSYLARVRAVTPDGDERLAATSFQYSHPHAQLTGRYRERLKDGGLVIEAEVDVVSPGRFHVEASLYSADRRHPIAWSQNAAEFEAGRHWLALRYPGVIFHDRTVDGQSLGGPYVLRFVALSTATQMPNAKNRLAEDAYVTQPYSLADFSTEPANNPVYLEGIQQIEREIDGLEAEGVEAAG
jgi:hypothetical protein